MEKIKKFFDNTFVSIVLTIVLYVVLATVFSMMTSIISVFVTNDGAVPASNLFNAIIMFVDTAIPAVLTVVILKLIYKDTYTVGVTTKGFGESLKMNTLVIVIAIMGVFINMYQGMQMVTEPEAVLTSFVHSFRPGVYEEMLYRAALCGLMMRKGKKTPAGIVTAVAVSALAFGLTHIINIRVSGGITPALIWQIVSATGGGAMFAAAYVRSKNLLGGVVSHTMIDLSNYLFIDLATVLTNELTLIDTVFNTFITVSCFVVAIWLLRPAKLKETVKKGNVEA